MSTYYPPPAGLPKNSIVDTYLRDSGGEGQDRSVTSQLTEIKTYCHQYGLELRRVYADVAKSGKSTVGRECFDDMIATFDDGIDIPDGLLIWDYARFARNTKDAVYNIALIENAGILVHSLTDYIPDNEYKDLIRFVKHMGNEAERQKNSRAVKRELVQLVKQYGAMFGTPPRGFKRDPLPPVRNDRTGEMRQLHRWIPDPEMIHLVQRAFEMRAKGETSQRIHAATGLYKTARGYTEFFGNKLFIGILEFGDLTIENYCEPIIPKEIWDEVQRIAQRRRLPQINIDHPRRIVSSFILSGLLYCQTCGAPMSGYSIKGWEYYVCSRRKSKHDCNSRRIPRAAIENEVIHQLTERMLTIERLLLIQTEMQNAWLTHSEESEKTRRDIEKRMSGVQRQIKNITSAIAETGHSKALLSQLEALERQETDLRIDLERVGDLTPPAHYTRPQLAEIAAALRAELCSEDIQAQRATLRGLVARIVAKRTDDQLLGVMYCIPPNYKVIGTVPPRGETANTLFRENTFEISIPLRSKKMPTPKSS